MLGPIVKYRSGSKAGQLAALDIELWFQKDVFQDKPQIVTQWAEAHNSLAQAWVNADPKNAKFVEDWEKTHPALVTKWIKDNPGTPKPKAADLAVLFFENFSREFPGKFASSVTKQTAGGKTEATIEPVKEGSDIQSIFFDMWRQDHPDVDIQDIPGDLATTSGSGLDPHITLQNADYQLDRVAPKWASDTKRDPASVRKEIEQILEKNATAPFGGLVGEKIVNVLEVNLDLCKKYGLPPVQ
jgi:potassium-transporting ATPase KdpC subunit